MKKNSFEIYEAPQCLMCAEIAERLFCVSNSEIKMEEEEEDILWGDEGGNE